MRVGWFSCGCSSLVACRLAKPDHQKRTQSSAATVTQTVDEKIYVQERFYDTAKVPTLFDFDVD